MTQLRTIGLVILLALLASEAAFAKHARAGLIETNVAGLPTSGASGISRIVLDGVDGADCVVGHGKFAVLCTFNGVSTWTAGGGGGSGTGTVTHTAGNLTANALMLGAGVADSKVAASLGTTTTLLHGNAAGAPTFSAVNLAADVTGLLPVANICTATNADASHFLRGDCTWQAVSGMAVAGAVSGSTHNKIFYSDNTGLLQELTLADGQVPTAASGLIVAGTIDAAPSNATYLMQTANSGTSAEQALGALASGCLSVTTGTGVVASSGSACGGGTDTQAMGYAFGTQSSGSTPAANTVYYAIPDQFASSTTPNLFAYTVPVTGHLTAVYWTIGVTSTGGTAGQLITHQVLKENTTATTGCTTDYNALIPSLNKCSETGLSFAVTAGNTLQFKITTPATWSTPASTVRGSVALVFGP